MSHPQERLLDGKDNRLTLLSIISQSCQRPNQVAFASLFLQYSDFCIDPSHLRA